MLKSSMKKILNLQNPVIGLSPMDGVSDFSFREITKKYGNPDIIYTEFVNVMGLCIAGFNTLKELDFSENQRPIIAQIYGNNPEYFYHAAKVIVALGFDGVDINMGCPAKTVTQSGSGAALIKNPTLAIEIIDAVKKGVRDFVDNGELSGLSSKTLKAVNLKIKSNFKQLEKLKISDTKLSSGQLNIYAGEDGSKFQRVLIPVSVKTRIGYDKPVTEDWISTLDSANPDWIAVHGRTLKQMYSGTSDRNELIKAVNSTSKAVLINGDIKNYTDALNVIKETNAYGVLIGRASLGNPWIFNREYNEDLVTFEERVKVMIEHTKLFVKHNPDERAFFQMRKHFGWYMKGFDGAKELREKLFRCSSLEEVKTIVNDFKNIDI